MATNGSFGRKGKPKPKQLLCYVLISLYDNWEYMLCHWHYIITSNHILTFSIVLKLSLSLCFRTLGCAIVYFVGTNRMLHKKLSIASWMGWDVERASSDNHSVVQLKIWIIINLIIREIGIYSTKDTDTLSQRGQTVFFNKSAHNLHHLLYSVENNTITASVLHCSSRFYVTRRENVIKDKYNISQGQTNPSWLGSFCDPFLYHNIA